MEAEIKGDVPLPFNRVYPYIPLKVSNFTQKNIEIRLQAAKEDGFFWKVLNVVRKTGNKIKATKINNLILLDKTINPGDKKKKKRLLIPFFSLFPNFNNHLAQKSSLLG